jgi:uncharacterized protein YukE
MYDWVIDEIRKELAKPEQTKYSDIVSDGGLDPRNKFDAQPEQEPIPFPSFMRKRIEQAMDDAINPSGMSVHDGKATVYASDLQRMIAVIDLAPPRKTWQGLTSEDWENTPDTGKQGCERDAELFDWIEQTLKDKNDTL